MKINELISEDTIIVSLKSNTKDEVIDELATALNEADKLNDLETYITAIHEREALGSTGVGFGIAIPHAKTKAVKEPALAYGFHKEGIDYEALDGEVSQLFFMIAAPEGEANLHLQTLAKLSRKLMNDEFRESLKQLNDKTSIKDQLSLIDKED